MKLGKVQYFSWPIGSSSPCESHPTLKKAREAAKKYEAAIGRWMKK
jgi:hypothetical protein